MADPPKPPVPKPPTPSAPKPPTAKTSSIPLATAKTSSVPLKKETVRITLRSKPGEGDAPAVTPAAPRPPAPAAAPLQAPSPSAPKPPAPAGGAPAAPKPPGAPKPPAPAGGTTIPLTPAPAPAGAPAVGKQTVQLKAAPATKPLARPAGGLQPTQAISSAPSAALASGALSTTAFDDDDDEEPAGMPIFAVAALILSAGLLITLLAGSATGIGNSMGIPVEKNPYEKKMADGTYKSTFDNRLPEIPKL